MIGVEVRVTLMLGVLQNIFPASKDHGPTYSLRKPGLPIRAKVCMCHIAYEYLAAGHV